MDGTLIYILRTHPSMILKLGRPNTFIIFEKMRKILILILFFSCSKESVNDNNECDNNYDPPFGGTIFIDPDIITEDDPTTFVNLSYAGTGKRQMYDRRTSWVNLEPFLFRRIR